MKKSLFAVSFLVMFIIAGCASTTHHHVLDSGTESQLEKRSYQTRAFDTSDKEKVLRAVISTLQDLGFVINRADLLLGSVSATKLDVYALKITVSVRERGGKSIVRANAQYNIQPVNDPKPYQDFFEALSKSLFLQAQDVD
ncbi:hypothetical protein ACBP82_12545 [Paenalcaligenes hominis]|uniref:hypothetical protein n=1 Tax=Paenalcaligenes hominis TaxID=643674 RepID=UPI0035237713